MADTDVRITVYQDERKVVDIDITNTVWHSVPDCISRAEGLLSKLFGSPISVGEPIVVEATVTRHEQRDELSRRKAALRLGSWNH